MHIHTERIKIKDTEQKKNSFIWNMVRKQTAHQKTIKTKSTKRKTYYPSLTGDSVYLWLFDMCMCV